MLCAVVLNASDNVATPPDPGNEGEVWALQGERLGHGAGRPHPEERPGHRASQPDGAGGRAHASA